MKVAIVSPFPPPFGGMSVLAKTFMKSFVKRDVNVLPINTHKNYRTGLNFINNVFRFIFFLIQLRKIVKSDVVLVISSSGMYFYLITIPSLLVAKLMHRPIVLDFVGGSIVENLKNSSLFLKYTFNLFDTVLVPTQVFKKTFENHGINCLVFPHIVDIERFHNSNSRGKIPVLLAAKTLTDYCGIDSLIEAFEIVKATYPLTEFIIAGDGKKRSELEKFAQKMGLEGIEFKGNVSYNEMPELFDRATIFVHGTKFESFGIVLVEAMASGTPIVSTNVGGIPNVLIDGEEGFLVDYGDAISMAKKIIELLENEELYNRFKVNGINKAYQFGQESLAPELIELLTQLKKKTN